MIYVLGWLPHPLALVALYIYRPRLNSLSSASKIPRSRRAVLWSLENDEEIVEVDEGAVAPPEAEPDHGDVPPLLLLRIAKELLKVKCEELLMIAVDGNREGWQLSFRSTEQKSTPIRANFLRPFSVSYSQPFLVT